MSKHVIATTQYFFPAFFIAELHSTKEMQEGKLHGNGREIIFSCWDAQTRNAKGKVIRHKHVGREGETQIDLEKAR